jgi:hypothetical protein
MAPSFDFRLISILRVAFEIFLGERSGGRLLLGELLTNEGVSGQCSFPLPHVACLIGLVIFPSNRTRAWRKRRRAYLFEQGHASLRAEFNNSAPAKCRLAGFFPRY